MNTIQLIKKYYVDPINRQNTSLGVEIELPLVSTQNAAVTLDFIKALASHIQNLGFHETHRTLDGYIYKWVNEDDDVCSFDTTWNTLELSMKNAPSLVEIANRFYPLLIRLQDFCLANGYYLCGKGINPNSANICTTPLLAANILAKSAFLVQYTNHHDGEIFHAICASVQTHIDATSLDQYLERFNLLRRAYVFDALFFANSMPPNEQLLKNYPVLSAANLDTLCFRDDLWRLCAAPNICARSGDITNAEELCQYLKELELFILPDGDDFRAIKPISFEKYCEQNENCEQALPCLRCMEPVSPTQNGCLELRSTCTQPLDDLFAPSAFYLGLVENYAVAKNKIDCIYKQFFPENTPLEVREKLMRSSDDSCRAQLKQEGLALLDIAISGLQSRGFNEENLLVPLRKQFGEAGFAVPAQRSEEDTLLQTKKQMSAIMEVYF